VGGGEGGGGVVSVAGSKLAGPEGWLARRRGSPRGGGGRQQADGAS
jgi:hypothetical protein